MKDLFPDQITDDIMVFGGSMIEQIVRIPEMPGLQQANVPLLDMAVLPGGSGGNVAVYAARLGQRVRLLDKWGQDEYTERLKSSLKEEGVNVRYCRVIPQVPSAFMIILTLPGGDWNGIVRLPAALSLLQEDLEPNQFQGIGALHFHGFCMRTTEERAGVSKAIELARDQGAVISIDASTPISEEQPEVLRGFFSQADLVFANQLEAQNVTGAKTLDGAAEGLMALGPQAVIVKLGSQGSVVVGSDFRFRVFAPAVDVVDTVGAGDALVAGTLSGLSQGQTLEKAVQRGTAAAALVCQGMGAQSKKFGLKEAEGYLKSISIQNVRK